MSHDLPQGEIRSNFMRHHFRESRRFLRKSRRLGANDSHTFHSLRDDERWEILLVSISQLASRKVWVGPGMLLAWYRTCSVSGRNTWECSFWIQGNGSLRLGNLQVGGWKVSSRYSIQISHFWKFQQCLCLSMHPLLRRRFRFYDHGSYGWQHQPRLELARQLRDDKQKSSLDGKQW